jgi:U3 small nucleolar ribonucleoprotein protein IMP4
MSLKKNNIFFIKEISLVFPNSIRLNRGAYVVKDLAKVCAARNMTDLIIVHEHRGVPDGMIVSHFPLGPTIYFGLEHTVMRHDVREKLDTVSLAYPHLIFHNFST